MYITTYIIKMLAGGTASIFMISVMRFNYSEMKSIRSLFGSISQA